MDGKEALRKLFFDNEDISVDITLNDRKVCEIYNTIKQDLDKLDKYKQLEKQLGINLELYVNTHLKGVYVKGMEPLWSGGQKNEIAHYAVVSFTKEYLEVCYATSHDTHYLWNPLEDYGKIWALTREELEDD